MFISRADDHRCYALTDVWMRRGAEEQPEAKYGDLAALAIGKTDKALNWHGFIELYEQIFFPLREKPIKFLEIGIFKGGSIEVWQDYFPKAKIYGKFS